MGKRLVSFLLSLCMVVGMLLAVPAIDAKASTLYSVYITGTENYDYAYQVLTIVNRERANEGLAPLSMDKDLLDSAMLRAKESALYFEHTRPNGESCFTSFPSFNGWKGENIAYGQNTPEWVMTSWMNSAGHKANILKAEYTSIGIGCFVDSNGRFCWAQCFGGKETVPVSKSGSQTVTTNYFLKSYSHICQRKNEIS